MKLPADFQFNQSNLQDYVDCPRLFYLRHVLGLAWPAVVAEPPLEHERHLRQGADFHLLIHRHALGISGERLSSTAVAEDLSRWWRNYLQSGPADLPAARYPEIVLSAPLGGHRLVAKYDLICIDPGQRAVIVDWKTYRQPVRRSWLQERLQTRVYPYLLVRAGAHLNEGQLLQPQQVEMLYWSANFPQDPERFLYDSARYEADGEYLTGLIEQIRGLGEEGFQLTTDEQNCRRCPYRSLCRRGKRAGSFDEADDEPETPDEFGILSDLGQVAEIVY